MRVHTEGLFSELGILPYPKIVLQAKLHFMHSFHFKYTPPSISNTWITNARHNPGVELRNSEDYPIPRPNLTLFPRFPLYSFSSAWNEAGPSKYHNNSIHFKNLPEAELLSNREIQLA
jgi:hypothetical protein